MATEGIKWLLTLDAKLDGAKAMVRQLGEVSTAADRAGAQLDRLGRASFGDWREVFKGTLAFKALEFGASLATGAVKKLVGATEEMVMASARSERTRAVFENLLGKEEAKETLRDLDRFAEMSEFTDGTLKRLGNELLRAGLRGADFRNALGMVLDVAAQAPDKLEGAQDAVASLSRIALTGKVDARSLRGLRLDPHEVAAQLAQDFGLAPDVIKKRLEEGAIDGASAMHSIFTVMERKTGKQLGGLGAEMANTFSARLEKVKDIPDEIFKSLKDSPGFRDMNEALAGVLKNFSADSPFGRSLRAGLSDVLSAVGKTIKEINWEAAAGVLKDIVDITRMWVPLLKDVASALGTIVHGVAEVGRWIGAAGTGAGMLALEKMGAENERAFEEALAQSDGRILRAGGATLVREIDAGVRDAAEIHSPSKLFQRHGEMLGEGLVLGLESRRTKVAYAAATIVTSPTVEGIDVVPSRVFNAGGVTVSVNVHVGGATATADDIAREVALQAPAALIAAMERLGIQAGVA